MKKLIFGFCYFIGITRCVAWWHRKRLMILCYHGITERPVRYPDDPDGLHVRRDRFAEQLDYLQAHYHIVSLREYLESRRKGRTLPHYSVVLTFDDGHRNFLTLAAAMLAERRIPASVFLITDRMSDGDEFSVNSEWSPADDKQSLTWTDARRLKKAYDFELGSHTCSHAVLTTLSHEEIDRELRDSMAALIAHLSGEALAFAYPKGGYSARIAGRARALGYSCALTTERGFNDSSTDLFQLRRHIVGDFDVPVFAAHVSGLVWWLTRPRTVFQRRPGPKTQLTAESAR